MKSLDENIESIYSGYYKLGREAYQEKIRYYERHQKNIELLTLKENLDIEIDYCCALYHVKEYYQFLNRVDKLIYLVIAENIFVYNQVDIYKDLLYKKAEALMETLDFYKAQHVLTELAKMDHENPAIQMAYRKNSIEKLRYEGQGPRAFNIGLIMSAGIIIAFEILYVRNFKTEWINQTEVLRNLILFAGILNMVSHEIWFRIKSKKAYLKLK
jgi:hypothetical protein